MESSLGKNPENYESICNETYTYEQKPINIDDFSEVEEKEVKERFEKRKQRRQEVAKKNQTVDKKKQNRKQEESKVKEWEMWKQLGELSKEFNDLKKSPQKFLRV